ncbi:MAG: carbonic anhydrase, partial [Alphaproteobacteria bacterium]|nr:carbonic anhydrase [Alphaproteobacteria bacterium]
GDEGQTPSIMVIACCDSRVDPATIFSAGPGELFVVRNVANLVPPWEPHGDYHGTSAALEFAVTSLGVRDIVVLGHGQCGGIGAFLANLHGRGASGGFIGKWMSLLNAARGEALRTAAESPDELQRALEFAGIRQSLDNLRTFPFVREGLDNGSLRLHGGWFAIASGKLLAMDQSSGVFEPVA